MVSLSLSLTVLLLFGAAWDQVTKSSQTSPACTEQATAGQELGTFPLILGLLVMCC